MELFLKKKRTCHFKDIYFKKKKEDKDSASDFPEVENMNESKSIVMWVWNSATLLSIRILEHTISQV